MPVKDSTDLAAADFLPLDDDAAARFADAFAPRIAGQAMRFRLPADLCQDVVQETLLRALRALPEFRGEAKLSTWVYRIAWRECARAVARQQRAARRGIAPAGEMDPVASAVPDAAETGDEFARVRAAMAELPDQQRLALGYHYLDGLAVAALCTLMDATPNTVKSWLKRGRDRIRERLS